MKRLLAILFACASIAAAQATIAITISVPTNDAVKVVDAWRKTQCAERDAAGACIQLKWDTLKAMVLEITATALNEKLATAYAWALETKDASLPSTVATAVTTKTSAQTTINTAKPAGTVQ